MKSYEKNLSNHPQPHYHWFYILDAGLDKPGSDKQVLEDFADYG
jgi:hypothetical protein